MLRRDPGPCSVCGAAHSACTGVASNSGPGIVVAVMTASGPGERIVQPLEADRVQATLSGGQFTSAHYTREKHGPSSSPKKR